MGQIHEDVQAFHLAKFPEETTILRPFLSGFDITWGKRRVAHNTELSVFFLRPVKHMGETFGFVQELMLVYSPYRTLEPRAMQAAEQFIEDDPARGRVEKLTLLLVSEAPSPEEWVRTYLASHHESRLVVAFQSSELKKDGHSAWYVRNKIAEQLFSRDLFDYRLPLENDTYFFGRDDLILDYRDAARRGENRGLFGLRKTGKTSFLFKLIRVLRSEDTRVLYYDCKSPSIRQLHWYELLEKIGNDLAASFGAKFSAPSDRRRFADEFTSLLSRSQNKKRTLLILDEIEYVSPFALDDHHWHEEFLPFWQTVWAAQSVHRKLSVLIAGVNPRIVEVDRINGVQNPLFAIVPFTFMRGLGLDEVRRMLRVLGRRVGLQFTDEATGYVFQRYGGHPLLTRLACSFVHRRAAQEKKVRPISVAKDALVALEDERDSELAFYCRHVVTEFSEFYPDEYALLEWLCAGRVGDYLEFADHPEHVRHLKEYGLVAIQPGEPPRVALTVVARFVALEEARESGRKTILKVIAASERNKWLARRKASITEDFAELNRLALASSLPSLFGPNSFPESHRFAEITVVDSDATFETFINCCNRCFVESVEANGKHQKRDKYFWEDVRATYPALHEALHRVKLYRHNRMHIQLNSGVEAALRAVLKQDLEGRDPARVDDLWFVLQQATLDGLWNALQIEISRRSA